MIQPLELGPGNGQDARAVAVQEGQLAWCVHIISAIIKGRMSTSAEHQARSEPLFCTGILV